MLLFFLLKGINSFCSLKISEPTVVNLSGYLPLYYTSIIRRIFIDRPLLVYSSFNTYLWSEKSDTT